MNDSGQSSPPPKEGPRSSSDVDIAKLADKVYRLMRNELRMERARGVRPPGRARG